MTTAHGSIAKLYMNGFDLSAYMRGAQPKYSADVADVSVWGLTSKAYIAGKTSASFAGNGIFDQDTTGLTLDRSDDILQAALGASGAIFHLPQGDVLAGMAHLGAIIGTSYGIDTPVDDVGAVDFEAQSSSGMGVGRILRPLAGALNISANGNGSAVDDQVHLASPGSTTFGAICGLQIINKGGGAGTVVVTIQDSADGSTGWATIATFTSQSAKNKSEIIEIAKGSTIRRWLRAAWTITGTPTWDIAVAVARRQA